MLVTAGEHILLYSDDLVEAHNPDCEMFGFPRLKHLLVISPSDTAGSSLINFLLEELTCFTGEGWEQEDDITLVVLQRTAASSLGIEPPAAQKTQEPPAPSPGLFLRKSP
jgi:serine phosphatase RsbU (regulator of sigma subunit)